MRNFLLFCQGFSKKVEKVIPAKTRGRGRIGRVEEGGTGVALPGPKLLRSDEEGFGQTRSRRPVTEDGAFVSAPAAAGPPSGARRYLRCFCKRLQFPAGLSRGHLI